MNLRAEWELRGRAVLRDLQWLFRAVGDGPSDVVLISGRYRRLESMRAEIERTIKAARITGVRVHALELAAPLPRWRCQLRWPSLTRWVNLLLV